MINDYSAQFGESRGGFFNYPSQSGTNRLHGPAFGYLENEDLDAGQPFNYTRAARNIIWSSGRLILAARSVGRSSFPISTTATTGGAADWAVRF